MELEDQLKKAGFSPHEATRLARVVLASAGRVVTFDFDNTCIRGDIGELFSYHLAKTAQYALTDERFWSQLVTPHLPDLKRIASELGDEPSTHPEYERFVGELNALYFRKLEQDGKAETYAWAVTLHVGMSVAAMRSATHECLDIELRTPESTETWPTLGEETVSLDRGIAPYRATQILMRALRDVGAHVWIVSASNEWSVEQAAERLFGVPHSNVIGNRVELDGDQLTSTTVEPSLFRQGKVDVIDQRIGERPFLAFGDTDTDLEMLMCAENAVLIDRGREDILHIAKKHDWIVVQQGDLGVAQ